MSPVIRFTPDDPYPTVLDRMRECRDTVARTRETIFMIGEHPPVITAGKSSSPEELSHYGPLNLFPVERGGALTYHGPGQVVFYPIVYLGEGNRSISRYLHTLEEILIRTLSAFTISGYRKDLAGVWTNGRKIASVGIAIQRWVAFHGVALNVNPDLLHFRAIRPCHLSPDQITSMQLELGENCPTASDVSERLVYEAEALAIQPRAWAATPTSLVRKLSKADSSTAPHTAAC